MLLRNLTFSCIFSYIAQPGSTQSRTVTCVFWWDSQLQGALCQILYTKISHEENDKSGEVSFPLVYFRSFTTPRTRNFFLCDHCKIIYVAILTLAVPYYCIDDDLTLMFGLERKCFVNTLISGYMELMITSVAQIARVYRPHTRIIATHSVTNVVTIFSSIASTIPSQEWQLSKAWPSTECLEFFTVESGGLAGSNLWGTLWNKEMAGAFWVKMCVYKSPRYHNVGQWHMRPLPEHIWTSPSMTPRRASHGWRALESINSRRTMNHHPSRMSQEASRGSPSVRCFPVGDRRPQTKGSPPSELHAGCSQNAAEALPHQRCNSCGRRGM